MSESTSKTKNLNKQSTLECKDLHAYLKSRTPELLEKLYNHPAICLAVYRELPELARQYVIRILFVEQPVPQAVIASWGTQAYSKEHVGVSEALTDLNVWKIVSIPGGLKAWELTPTFKRNLKVALLGGGRPWSMSSLDADNKARDTAFLDAYCMQRWECLLHYMVGSNQTEGISADAVRILLHAGLMKRDEEDGAAVISRLGFQFLLLDTSCQVWHFMLKYLDSAESKGLNLPECLALLFQLSFSTLGRDYSTEGLSSGLLTFLQHLREFGLVYQRKRKAGRFYPTRLAINLTARRIGAGDAMSGNIGQEIPMAPTPNVVEGDTQQRSGGYIIVETNYRVYAYTNSTLQVALLGLFTELLYRFPNLVVGVLTRDSVRQALRGGITADQIISYLELHSHPSMIHESAVINNSPLPATVIDQIRLWENERNRFTYTEGVVYNQFLSQADYTALKDYAQQLDVLVWHNTRTRTCVVTKEGHEPVKKFWKRYSKTGS